MPEAGSTVKMKNIFFSTSERQCPSIFTTWRHHGALIFEKLYQDAEAADSGQGAAAAPPASR